jgi:hypothetical protein
MGTRTADLSNLVKFNNIVSSYLTVETVGQKTETRRNTASLIGEIGDMKKDDADLMNERLKKADIKVEKTKAGDTGANLDVNNINKSFLNYSTTPKD